MFIITVYFKKFFKLTKKEVNFDLNLSFFYKTESFRACFESTQFQHIFFSFSSILQYAIIMTFFLILPVVEFENKTPFLKIPGD